MEQDGEDEEDDHEDDRAGCCRDNEETSHANLCNVDTSHQVLEGTWVYETLGVNVGLGDEENVVPVCKVKERDTSSGKTENKRSNAGVDEGY